MAHPLRRYARHVQAALNKEHGYQWCLRFVQKHWDDIQDLSKQERLAKLAELAKRDRELHDLAVKSPARR